MRATDSGGRRSPWRAYAAMELRVGLYQWLTRVGPSRHSPLIHLSLMVMPLWLFPLGNPSLGSQIPSHNTLAAVLWIAGGVFLAWSLLAATTPANGYAAFTPRTRDWSALLPISTGQRVHVGLIGRLAGVAIWIGLGLVLMLTAWWLAGRSGERAPDLAALLLWLLGIVPLVAAVQVFRLVAAKAYRRLPHGLATALVAVAMIEGTAVGCVAGSRVPAPWQIAGGVAAGTAAYLVLVGSQLLGSVGRSGVDWLWDQWSQRADRTSVAGEVTGEAPGAEAIPAGTRPGRWRKWELGWALVPEIDYGMWARSARLVFGGFAVLGAACAVGWPLLSYADHVLFEGEAAGGPASAAGLARGPFFCLYCLPLAGVVFAFAMWWVDFPSRRARPVGALLPVEAPALWQARLVAGLIYGLGFLLLGQAFELIGESVAAALGATWPVIPLNDHWLVLAMPALAMIAWAQSPLLRNPFRLLSWLPAAWGIATAVAAIFWTPFLAGAAEAKDLHVWPMVMWPVAVVVVALSAVAVRPSVWPVSPDGRLELGGNLATTGVMVLCSVTSGMVISAAFSGLMALLPG